MDMTVLVVILNYRENYGRQFFAGETLKSLQRQTVSFLQETQTKFLGNSLWRFPSDFLLELASDHARRTRHSFSGVPTSTVV